MAYLPGQHSLTAKAMGFSQATPTDARSYFFDAALFSYRPYQSTAEVLAYLNLDKYRVGNFPIFVNVGGVLTLSVESFGFTGGVIHEFSFRNDRTDAGLIETPGPIVEQTLTDGPNIIWDFSQGQYAKVTLGGNRALSVTNAPTPSTGYLEVLQDSTGTRTLFLPGNVAAGNAISTGADELDILEFTKSSRGVFWKIQNYGVFVPDTTLPLIAEVTVANITPSRVDFVFTEDMKNPWSAASAFAVTGHTISSITQLGPAAGYFTVTPAFVFGETRTLSYTQPATNKMQDMAGNLLSSFSGKTIVDYVLPVGIVPLDFTGSTGVNYLGGADWNYVQGGASSFGNLGKTVGNNKAVAANAQGRLMMDHHSFGSNAAVLGFHTVANTEIPYTSMIAGVMILSATDEVFKVDGGVMSPTAIATIPAGTTVALLRESSGTTKIQTSPIGAYTWTTIATLTSTSAAKLYAVADIAGPSLVGQIIGAYGDNLVA